MDDGQRGAPVSPSPIEPECALHEVANLIGDAEYDFDFESTTGIYQAMLVLRPKVQRRISKHSQVHQAQCVIPLHVRSHVFRRQ